MDVIKVRNRQTEKLSMIIDGDEVYLSEELQKTIKEKEENERRLTEHNSSN